MLPYPLKEGKIAFVTRADLARATAACLLGDGHAGKIYELSGPEALSMPELAKVLSEVTGDAIAFNQPSEAEYVTFSHADGASEGMLAMLLSIYRAAETGEWSRVTDHIQELTGQAARSVRAVAEEMLA